MQSLRDYASHMKDSFLSHMKDSFLSHMKDSFLSYIELFYIVYLLKFDKQGYCSYICRQKVTMSKVKAIYHVVFGTKDRQQTITPEYRKDLYAYIYAILKGNQCFVIRINGMAEHVHILFDLNPTKALAEIVRSIKQSTSSWLKGDARFPFFEGWCRGYYAYTLSMEHVEGAIEYIKNQQTHHNTYGYLQEVKSIAGKEGLEWHDDDLK